VSASPTSEGGQGLIRASWVGTGTFVGAALLATVAPETVGDAFAAFSLLLFGLGTVAFGWAFLVAVNRSRTELIGVGGLYFLAGCAPAVVQRSMMASLGVEVVVALAAAGLRPYTSVAFGILVPVYGLGLAGLWAARHGTFPSRDTTEPRPRASGGETPGDGSPDGGPG
jgi:hypothetical protein